MLFVDHRALSARLGDARFVPICSLMSAIVRGILSVLLSAFSSWLLVCVCVWTSNGKLFFPGA